MCRNSQNMKEGREIISISNKYKINVFCLCKLGRFRIDNFERLECRAQTIRKRVRNFVSVLTVRYFVSQVKCFTSSPSQIDMCVGIRIPTQPSREESRMQKNRKRPSQFQ